MNCITCILIDDNDHQLLVIFQMKVSNGIWIIFLQLDDIEGAQNDTISAKTHCREKCFLLSVHAIQVLLSTAFANDCHGKRVRHSIEWHNNWQGRVWII